MTRPNAAADRWEVDHRPVYILGAAHSGTTILYRMLAYHPDLTWISQYSLRAGQVPGRRRIPGAGIADIALRRLPHDWQKRDPTGLARIIPRPGEAATVWNYLLRQNGDDAAITRQVLDEFCRRSHMRLLAKFPMFHEYWRTLHRAHPDALYIHIIRDGRAVALSNRSKTPGGSMEPSARHWVDVVHAAEATSEAAKVVTVRYEDFCDDVHGRLTQIIRAVDLSPERFPFDRMPTTLSVTNGRWLSAASSKDMQTIMSRQQDVLTRYGYQGT